MATYDENLNIVEDVNVSNFPQYQNIKYNIGSITKHTEELKDYFAKIFDKSTHISGSITYGITPDNILVEHYNPKTKNVTFEQVNCFHFNNVVIEMQLSPEYRDTYVKYYKLQPYNDIIEKNPNASHNPNAKDKYRFVYTCQKVSMIKLDNQIGLKYGIVLNGYYGINGWEWLGRNPNFNPLNCYKFQKDGESKELFNPEYYQLTKKTNKLEKLSEPIINLQTGNSIQQVKFPGFYANNKSFIRFANQLTNDTTQYKLADNKDSHHNDVLPINSDNLGYEDLKDNKIVLFNGFDNNYQLINIQKNSTSIAFLYIDLETRKEHVLRYDLQTTDKIYIVKRSQNIISYNNNNFITYVFEGCNYGSASKITTPNDFVYTLSFQDYYYNDVYDNHVCRLTGPTTLVAWKDEWKIKANTIYLYSAPSNLNGVYIDNGYYGDVDQITFSSINDLYKNCFTQQSYDILYNINTHYQCVTNVNKIKMITTLITDQKESEFTPPQASSPVRYFTNSININLSGIYWKLKYSKENIAQKEDFQIADFPDKNGISIISKINNKPGFLPNYINLLSNFNVNSTAYAFDNYPGTVKDVGFSVSTNINSPLGWIGETPYDLKYTGKKTKLSSYLRFGFESTTEVPQNGYVIFLELH